MWKLDYLRSFGNCLDINYVFESTCNLWALCCFNLIPCVISRWSPDLISVVFVTTVSNPGQYPFILDDAFFPTSHGGKRSLDCVWVRLLCPWGEKTTCKKDSIWHVLFAAHKGRDKTLRVWVRLLPMGQEIAYQRGQYHASCEWVDP